MSNDYIRNAFKSLEDLEVVIEPIKTPLLMEDVGLEPIEDDSAKTVRELFEKEHSYIVVREFDNGGTKYCIFMEALNNGQSCEVDFEEFDSSHIDGVLLQILDADRDFLCALEADDLGLDSSFGDVTAAATAQLNGDTAPEAPAETAGEAEGDSPEATGDGHDNNIRDYVSPEDEHHDDEHAEDELPPAEADIEPKEMEDGKGSEEDESSLHESQKFNLQDEKEMKEAEEVVDNNKEDEPAEVVIDIDADTIDQLAKDNAGSFIFTCTNCGAEVLRTLEQLKTVGYERQEDQDGNKTDVFKLKDTDDHAEWVSCPECHKCDTFNGNRRIEAVDVDAEVSGEPAPAAEPAPEPAPEEEKPEDTSEPAPLPELPSEEEHKEGESGKGGYTFGESLEKDAKTADVQMDSIEESRYDRLVSRYLRENYVNVKAYKTTSASVDDAAGKVILEGVITFKSGKEKPTKFVFEAKEMTKKNQVKLVGINETFSKSKAYTLLGRVSDKRFVAESLSYRYDVGDRKVKGKVEPLRKR